MDLLKNRWGQAMTRTDFSGDLGVKKIG